LPHAPSALPYQEGETAPLALDTAGLARVRKAFVGAAMRAVRLGMDAVEIHSAHGYLLHQFPSPIANQRNDKYGGSLENPLPFPLEVFDAVRAAFPAEMPVGVKVSATDWVDRGWDLEQTITLSKELNKRGADWVAVSSGSLSPGIPCTDNPIACWRWQDKRQKYKFIRVLGTRGGARPMLDGGLGHE
jgi:2,4-dienoyl-CoA reductase-like NADH-dependent reductase (Old Yellow Enzyme family)